MIILSETSWTWCSSFIENWRRKRTQKQRSWARGFTDKCFLKGNVFIPFCLYFAVILHSIDCVLWLVGLEDEVIYIKALKKLWIFCHFGEQLMEFNPSILWCKVWSWLLRFTNGRSKINVILLDYKLFDLPLREGLGTKPSSKLY